MLLNQFYMYLPLFRWVRNLYNSQTSISASPVQIILIMVVRGSPWLCSNTTGKSLSSLQRLGVRCGIRQNLPTKIIINFLAHVI